MTVYQGSRYENESVVSVKTVDGWHPTVFRPNMAITPARGEILSEDGEDFQVLAQRYYGNPELWWIIADANPAVLYPDNVPPGTVLRIP